MLTAPVVVPFPFPPTRVSYLCAPANSQTVWFAVGDRNKNPRFGGETNFCFRAPTDPVSLPWYHFFFPFSANEKAALCRSKGPFAGVGYPTHGLPGGPGFEPLSRGAIQPDDCLAPRPFVVPFPPPPSHPDPQQTPAGGRFGAPLLVLGFFRGPAGGGHPEQPVRVLVTAEDERCCTGQPFRGCEKSCRAAGRREVRTIPMCPFAQKSKIPNPLTCP